MAVHNTAVPHTVAVRRIVVVGNDTVVARQLQAEGRIAAVPQQQAGLEGAASTSALLSRSGTFNTQTTRVSIQTHTYQYIPRVALLVVLEEGPITGLEIHRLGGSCFPRVTANKRCALVIRALCTYWLMFWYMY